MHAGIGFLTSDIASQNNDWLMQQKIAIRVGDFISYVVPG
jgi:hypothetical protein